MLPRFVAFLLASAMAAYAVHALVKASASGEDMPRTPLFGAVLAVLMVNVHTIADELLILLLFVKFVGLDTVSYSLKHFYSVWIEPQVGAQPAIGPPHRADSPISSHGSAVARLNLVPSPPIPLTHALPSPPP
jgi:hypothetical protein